MAVINEILKRAETVPNEFIATVDAERLKIIRLLEDFILSLETSGGKLVLSESNLAELNRIAELLDNALFAPESEYVKALEKYALEIGIQADLRDELIGGLTSFERTGLFQQVVKNNQLQAVKLFDKTVVDDLVTNRLRNTIQTAIVNGDSLQNLFRSLDEATGEFQRYVKTWGLTTFSTLDNQYAQAVSDSLGFEWYEYEGELMENSRDFCRERVGNIYHRSEIEQWASLDWQGKAAGTTSGNIFSLRGGWNCIHSFKPVLTEDVPDSIKGRIS